MWQEWDSPVHQQWGSPASSSLVPRYGPQVSMEWDNEFGDSGGGGAEAGAEAAAFWLRELDLGPLQLSSRFPSRRSSTESDILTRGG